MQSGNISAFAQLKVETLLMKDLAVLPAQLVSGYALLPPTHRAVVLKLEENRIFLSLLKAWHASPPNEPRVTAGISENTLLVVDLISSAQVVGCSDMGSWSMARALLDLFLGRALDLLSRGNEPLPCYAKNADVSVGKILAELESLNPNISF